MVVVCTYKFYIDYKDPVTAADQASMLMSSIFTRTFIGTVGLPFSPVQISTIDAALAVSLRLHPTDIWS